MDRRRFLKSAGACAGLPLLAGAQARASALHQLSRDASEQIRQALDLWVPHGPIAVRTRRGEKLVYELHFTSFTREPLTVTGVDVLYGASRHVIAEVQGERLARTFVQPGLADGEERLVLREGRRAILYLDFQNASFSPTDLIHRVYLRAASGPGRPAEEFSVSGGPARIALFPMPVLGPPLRDGPWAAVYDPELENGHRRFVYAVDGRARIPGRHAIDWIRAGGPRAPAGSPWSGDLSDGGGADVLAVADALVAAVRDGVDEPPPGTPRPRPALADATGNYVALDLGNRFVFYEHLRPGLAVRRGDRVRKGQVIGQVGSTGQAGGPHLHFHVADANSPLRAEGQPFLIEGLELGRKLRLVRGVRPGRGLAADEIARRRRTAPGFPRPTTW